jgi:hypothetical protein
VPAKDLILKKEEQIIPEMFLYSPDQLTHIQQLVPLLQKDLKKDLPLLKSIATNKDLVQKIVDLSRNDEESFQIGKSVIGLLESTFDKVKGLTPWYVRISTELFLQTLQKVCDIWKVFQYRLQKQREGLIQDRNDDNLLHRAIARSRYNQFVWCLLHCNPELFSQTNKQNRTPFDLVIHMEFCYNNLIRVDKQKGKIKRMKINRNVNKWRNKLKIVEKMKFLLEECQGNIRSLPAFSDALSHVQCSSSSQPSSPSYKLEPSPFDEEDGDEGDSFTDVYSQDDSDSLSAPDPASEKE